MGCIASLGLCNPCCNISNNIGLDCAGKNRLPLSVVNGIMVLLGVCFAIVGCLGAFSDKDLIKTFPWMTWVPANFTMDGYDQAGQPIYNAHPNDDGITFYSNIWGITDEYNTAKLAWRDYRGAGEDCADYHLSILSCMGCGLFFTFSTLTQVANRAYEDWDTNGNKCAMLVTTLFALICNSFAVGLYHHNCFGEFHALDMEPKMGIGYYSFLLCILLANVPNFIVNLLIKVPGYEVEQASASEKTPLTAETSAKTSAKTPSKGGASLKKSSKTKAAAAGAAAAPPADPPSEMKRPRPGGAKIPKSSKKKPPTK